MGSGANGPYKNTDGSRTSVELTLNQKRDVLNGYIQPDGTISRKPPLFSSTGHVSSSSISAHREDFYGKSAGQIEKMLNDAGYKTMQKSSKHAKSKARIIVVTNPSKQRNINQVQVSPGSPRHGNVPYVKISTTNSGKYKVVDGTKNDYKAGENESAKIFYRRNKK